MSSDLDPVDDVDAERDATVLQSGSEGELHPPVRPGRPHALEMIQGPGAPTTFVLAEDDMVIGRSSRADLRIADQELSRSHVRLRRVHDAYHCSDAESRNGVFLNGLRIQSAVLRDGDTLQIGRVILVYHEGS